MQAKKLEDTLWQKVFYSPISEFRKRLAAPKSADARGQELRQKVNVHLLHAQHQLRVCCDLTLLLHRISDTPSSV